MRKIIIALTLALSLGACATVQNPINSTQLATIESAYGVVLAGAVAYRNRPRCTKTALESVSNLCARRSIVIRLQDADRQAQIALGKARVFTANNPTLDASSLLQAAQAAVNAFSQIQSGAQ
jgi:uncharacterized protein YceK